MTVAFFDKHLKPTNKKPCPHAMHRHILCSLLFALAPVPAGFADDAGIVAALKQLLPQTDVRWTPPSEANLKRIRSLFDAR